MNAKRTTRWVIIIGALCAGFSVAGREPASPVATPSAATESNPLSAETLPIAVPDPGTGQREGRR
jgi:hypothetical protein